MRERLLSGETVFEGVVASVRVDTVSLPGGGAARREVVEHEPSVVVVAIDREGNLVLVRQFRYPVGETLVEAPAGVVEDAVEFRRLVARLRFNRGNRQQQRKNQV